MEERREGKVGTNEGKEERPYRMTGQKRSCYLCNAERKFPLVWAYLNCLRRNIFDCTNLVQGVKLN
jgi:hypothetical protein